MIHSLTLSDRFDILFSRFEDAVDGIEEFKFLVYSELDNVSALYGWRLTELLAAATDWLHSNEELTIERVAFWDCLTEAVYTLMKESRQNS